MTSQSDTVEIPELSLTSKITVQPSAPVQNSQSTSVSSEVKMDDDNLSEDENQLSNQTEQLVKNNGSDVSFVEPTPQMVTN